MPTNAEPWIKCWAGQDLCTSYVLTNAPDAETWTVVVTDREGRERIAEPEDPGAWLNAWHRLQPEQTAWRYFRWSRVDVFRPGESEPIWTLDRRKGRH